MLRLLGQLVVPPAVALILLKVCVGSWWTSFSVRSRWSMWILLSAGLLLLFQYFWPILERSLRRKHDSTLT